MAGTIFLLHDNNRLVEMAEQKYESEDLLQRLLAQYPNLLAGDQIDQKEPRRWILVKREAPVPFEQDGGGRWSLDHLLLDQDGIPTFVEVKRSTDPRIRREVVGQMLDYAANAVVYWSAETMQTQLAATCAENGQETDQLLAELLGEASDSDRLEGFWQQVKTNLKAGRIRLIFVSDEIPTELQRIVEFLNQQMDPAEVLAVEIKQFVGKGLKTLVPRVIGQSVVAQQAKRASAPSTGNYSKYNFEGKDYPKRRLVLAVVSAYLRDNPETKFEQLEDAFPKNLQGSFGVVRQVGAGLTDKDRKKRFFSTPDDVLTLHKEQTKVVICGEWGLFNIPKFIERAQELGYVISEAQ